MKICFSVKVLQNPEYFIFRVFYKQQEIFPEKNQYIIIIPNCHEHLFGSLQIITYKKKFLFSYKHGVSKVKLLSLNKISTLENVYRYRNNNKYLSYNIMTNLNEIVNKLEISSKILDFEYEEKHYMFGLSKINKRLLSLFCEEKKKELCFFISLFGELMEGSHFCKLEVIKGIFLLNKIKNYGNSLEFGNLKSKNYEIMTKNFAKKYKNYLYYAIGSYSAFLSFFVKKRRIVTEKVDVSRKRILSLLNIEDKDLIMVNISNCESPHVVFESEKTLIISFSGTKDVRDVLNDIDCGYKKVEINEFVQRKNVKFEKNKPFSFFYTHEGINKRSLKYIEKFEDTIYEILEKRKLKKIIFTGHSLGGSIAINVGLRLLNKNRMVSKIIAFSPPPIFTKNLVKIINEEYKNKITSIVNGNDVYPRLSYGSIMDLKFISSSLGGNVGLIKNNVMGDLISHYDDVKNFTLKKKLHTKMYIPGEIYHIKYVPLKGDLKWYQKLGIGFEGDCFVKKVDFRFFGEIKCDLGFQYDHMPIAILNLFEKCLKKEEKLEN